MSSLAQILFDVVNKYRAQMSINISSRSNRYVNVIFNFTFNADNIKEGMTVIAGNAFSDDHPELVRAREIGVEVIRYHKF